MRWRQEGVRITASEVEIGKEGRKKASQYALGGLGLGTPFPDKGQKRGRRARRPLFIAFFSQASALCDQGRDPTYGDG